jgi:hypothetical protein
MVAEVPLAQTSLGEQKKEEMQSNHRYLQE